MTINFAPTPEMLQQTAFVPRAQMRTAIVVPCYNEAERLDMAAFTTFLSGSRGIDLVFVNDGSKDATLDRLATLHALFPARVTVLSLRENAGKAEAVRQGLLHASREGADLVGYWDADLATPLAAIEDFVRVASRMGDLQVVYGARRKMLGHKVDRTPIRRAVSRVCATLARMAIRLPVGDTQCGAKLLRTSPALTAALSTPFTAGWLFDVELFTRLSASLPDRSRAFYEYPLAEWTEIAGSKVSGRAILRSGFSMLRLIGENRLGLPASATGLRTAVADVVRAPARARTA